MRHELSWFKGKPSVVFYPDEESQVLKLGEEFTVGNESGTEFTWMRVVRVNGKIFEAIRSERRR